jgi:hypothetical protein
METVRRRVAWPANKWHLIQKKKNKKQKKKKKKKKVFLNIYYVSEHLLWGQKVGINIYYGLRTRY